MSVVFSAPAVSGNTKNRILEILHHGPLDLSIAVVGATAFERSGLMQSLAQALVGSVNGSVEPCYT